MRDHRRSLAWRSSVLAAGTGVFLVMGSVSAQAAPVPTPTPSPAMATAKLPHWGSAASQAGGETVNGSAAAKRLADGWGSGASAAAKARAAAHKAAAVAATAHVPAFAPGAVNRTVVGSAPEGSWAPSVTALGGAPAPATDGSSSSPRGAKTAKATEAQTTAVPTTSAQATTSGAPQVTTLAAPTSGFPGAGASGPGLGVQSFYGLESFNLTPTLTGGVNLANGNLVLRNQTMAYNAPGLSVNLDTFFNTGSSVGPGAFSYAGSLSTGQDVGLQVSTSTVTFYGPSGFTAVFTANGSGGWTAPGGVNADLVHNADGTWSLTYHASSEKLTFTSGGYLIKDVDRNGVGLSLSYDTSNRLTSLTDANGRVTTFTYNSFGITKMTDPVGRSVNVTYYSSGGLHTITDATGAVTTIDNSRTGSLDGIQTPDGNWTYFTYDSSGRVTSVTRYLTPGAQSGNAAVTAFAYNSTSGASSSTRETSPTGGVSTYALDTSGRVTSVTDPLGRTRSQTWTPNSDLATATDAMGGAGTNGGAGTAGNITTYSYDTLNNRTAVTLPTGAASRAAYTATSGSTGTAYQPKTATDPSGHIKAYTYDSVGNVVSVRDTTSTTAGGTGATASSFTYQAASSSTTTSPTQCGGKTGQVCTSTDGNGNVTTYRYDSLGNLTKVTPAAPLGATTYTYDTAGRVSSVVDGKGQKTQYAYDADDRITTTTYNNGATLTNAYDADGNLTQSTDSTAGTSYFDYDALDREVWRSEPNMGGNGLATGYDAANRVTSVDDIYGQVTYAYDVANQLTSMTEPSGSGTDTITFAYNRNGAETSRTYPGGLVQTTTLDNSGRPTRITAAVSNGAVKLSDLGYSYTAAGGSGTSADRDLVQSRTDYAGTTAPAGSVTAYGHDGLDRLISARETTPTGAVNAAWTYTYDRAGNRTAATTTGATTVGATASTAAATTSWGYNGANQATSRNSSTTGWAYDANGNQTAATWGTGTYDQRDALTSATRTGSSTPTTFAYLGAGNGERQSVNDTDTINGLLGMAATFTNGVGTAYRHTPDGRVISAGMPDGSNRYYSTDNLGSVTLVATTSDITVSYSYDPYGTLRAAGGTEAATNPIRYGQGYTDTSTGLTKLGIRYYDPAQGRFTQQDPTGQDPHYMYAANSPSTYSDPTGARVTFAAAAGAVGAVVGAGIGVAAVGAACVSTAGIACAVAAVGAGSLLGSAGGGAATAIAGGKKEEITDNLILGSAGGIGYFFT
jgi:RHS repeat-associated protein